VKRTNKQQYLQEPAVNTVPLSNWRNQGMAVQCWHLVWGNETM